MPLAGSDAAVNALKSSLAAPAAAVNSITKAAHQAAEFTETSVKAATAATADAVKTAANKASPGSLIHPAPHVTFKPRASCRGFFTPIWRYTDFFRPVDTAT